MNADKALELARLAYPNDENLRVTYMLGLNAGAEWQKAKMLKDAVEGEVITNGLYPYEPRIIAPYPNCPYAFGDKVRIVILEDEEKSK